MMQQKQQYYQHDCLSHQGNMSREASEWDDWENFKENSMPIKSGRSISTLERASTFTGNISAKHALEVQMDEFESRISSAEEDEDVLAIWMQYIQWIDASYPQGNLPLKKEVFERCGMSLAQDERYKNDERYLKIWIAYADLLQDPTDVFRYLRANNIGQKLALFYVALAWVSEHRGNFPKAEKAYEKGIECNAQPIDMLLKRQKEFRRRMSRHWLNHQQQQQQSSSSDFPARIQNDENNLSRSRLNAPFATPSLPTRLRDVGESVVRVNQGGRIEQKPNAKFGIFVDSSPKDADEWSNQYQQQRVDWKEIAKSDKNENIPNPSSWKGHGFGNEISTKSKPLGSSSSSFKVFVENDTENDLPRQLQEKFSNLSHQEFPSRELGILSRNSSDSSVDDNKRKCPLGQILATPMQQQQQDQKLSFKTKEAMMRTPLGNSTTVATLQQQESKISLAVKASALKEEMEDDDSSTGKANNLVDDDMTLNTKFAKEDILELFGSPSNMKPPVTTASKLRSALPTTVKEAKIQLEATTKPKIPVFIDHQENLSPNLDAPRTIESRPLNSLRSANILSTIEQNDENQPAGFSRPRGTNATTNQLLGNNSSELYLIYLFLCICCLNLQI